MMKLLRKLRLKFKRTPKRDFQMKLFVWKDVLEGYIPRDRYTGKEKHMYYGVMIAFAPDVETARELLRKDLRTSSGSITAQEEAELAREPEVYIINTFAAAIDGYEG